MSDAGEQVVSGLLRMSRGGRSRYKSATTGRYVTTRYASRHPATTVKKSSKRSSRPK